MMELKPIEKIVYSELCKLMLSQTDYLKDIFSMKKRIFLNEDDERKLKNLVKKLQDDEKEYFISSYYYLIEWVIFNNLRLLQSDFYELTWYERPVSQEQEDEYWEKYPWWHWSLIKLVDLKWDCISNSSMYDSFFDFHSDEVEKCDDWNKTYR